MPRTELQDADREEVAEFIERHWHSQMVMSGGRAWYPHKESGFIERRDGQLVGLLTYRIEGETMEILTVNATLEGQGIGTSLMLNTIETARRAKCRRIFLTTTNDALRAIGFYQRVGFRLVSINVGVIDEARKIKPQIPLTGERGIDIHDEIVMELLVEPYLDA